MTSWRCAVFSSAILPPYGRRSKSLVADGALGFWQAIEEVWPTTRGQRCWVHKTANVLNKLPKSQ
jgi:transposase-like protein